MSFPPNKTFRELGLDPNATFRVVDNDHETFRKGDLLKLASTHVETDSPRFKRVSDEKKYGCYLFRLEYAAPPSKEYGREAYTRDLRVYPDRDTPPNNEFKCGGGSGAPESTLEPAKIKTFGTLEMGDKVRWREMIFTIIDFSKNKNVLFLNDAENAFLVLDQREFASGMAEIIQPPSPEQPVEMTLEDVEKALGKKIKIVEGK